MDGIAGYACPPGTFCPPGSSFPLGCPPGTYNPSEAMEECEDCLPGFICPGNTTFPEECPVYHYCPPGSATGSTCPIGTYGSRVSVKNGYALVVTNAQFGTTEEEAGGNYELQDMYIKYCHIQLERFQVGSPVDEEIGAVFRKTSVAYSK